MLDRQNNANTLASLFTYDKNVQKVRQAQYWLAIRKQNKNFGLDFH